MDIELTENQPPKEDKQSFSDPQPNPQFFFNFNYNPESFSYCLEMQSPKQSSTSYHNVVDQICVLLNTLSIDLRLTPMKEILQIVSSEFRVDDWNKVKKELLKRKRKLKIQHAKQRKIKPVQKLMETIQIPQEKQIKAELKKKRNRLNAQKSRDKRKEKVNEITKQIQELQKQTKRVQQENKKLKEQLNFNAYVEPLFHSKPKFMQLMVVFGIIFLISLFKGAWNPMQNNLQPISEIKNKLLTVDDQTIFLEKGKQLLSQLGDDEKEMRKIRGSILKQMEKNENPQTNLEIPNKILSQILELKSEMIED